MISISEIGTIEEAEDLVYQTTAKIIKTILGLDHKVKKAEEDTNVNTEPYATMKILTLPNQPTWRNDPIHSSVDPVTGDESAIFEDSFIVQVKMYKGNAMARANKVLQSLNMKTYRYQLLGTDKRIGLQNVSAPVTSNTPIDQQGWESGATFSMTYNVLSKMVILGGLGVIEEVNGGSGVNVYTTNDMTSQDKVTRSFNTSYPPR